MKKGSTVQRSSFSHWLRLSSARTGSLLAATSWLIAACSGGTIQDDGRNNGQSGGNENSDSGGSGNGKAAGGGPAAGSGGKSNQGGQAQGTSGSGASGSGTSGGSTAGSGTAGNGASGSGTSGNTSVAGNGSGGSVADAIPSVLPAQNACNSTSNPGPRVLRRLSAAEFNASIRDLFGDSTAPVAPVFNDQRVLGFSVDSNALTVQGLNADQLMNNAEAVASWAVGKYLSQIASCSTLDSSCGKQWIKTFGRKAFRVPLTDAQISDYSTKLFLTETKFSDGVTAVVSAMLQSPYFLYRSELGPTSASGGDVTLTSHEVASSLSYLLTGSTPDATLSAAADSAASSGFTRAALDDQATRLLGTPGASDALMNFMSGWLGLDRLDTNVKDASVYDMSAMRADMAAETRTFLLAVFAGQTQNTVSDLFDTNRTFLNKNLANYYKLDASQLSDTSFTQTNLPTGQRDGGILAQASILAGYARADISSPTQRGHLVRSRLLCQDVPPPPAGLDTKFTPATGATTTRDHYLKEHASPDRTECYGCHKLMDPIGVAFEHYDSFGRWRATEKDVTIDATGTIVQASVSRGDVAIDGLSGSNGLQQYLASSPELKSCLVRYWSYYAYGSASWAYDGCTYDSIKAEATTNSYSLKSILMAIIHAPRFTKRSGNQ